MRTLTFRTKITSNDLEIASVMLVNNIHKISTINEKDFKYIKKISLLDFNL